MLLQKKIINRQLILLIRFKVCIAFCSWLIQNFNKCLHKWKSITYTVNLHSRISWLWSLQSIQLHLGILPSSWGNFHIVYLCFLQQYPFWNFRQKELCTHFSLYLAHWSCKLYEAQKFCLICSLVYHKHLAYGRCSRIMHWIYESTNVHTQILEGIKLF